MPRPRKIAVTAAHASVAMLAALVFGARFVDCLPFSGSTRAFNPETASTLYSFLIYAGEPWSFPIGRIDRLTFPFFDANIGNVGALPLLAIGTKLLGSAWVYFRTFDYFVFTELASSFLTAMFVQHALGMLGIYRFPVRAVGGFLAGTSFLLFTRSEWLQPFCVVAFPIFGAWIVLMLGALRRQSWNLRHDFAVLGSFPIAALLDTYALFAIMLGTAVIAAWELVLDASSGRSLAGARGVRFSAYVLGGTALSLGALWMIGMYPLPPVPSGFTSYDFGVGGRFHGANLLSLLTPVARGEPGVYPQSSLLVRLGFPFTTERFGRGQYEGVAYVGTALVAAMAGLAAYRFWRRFRPIDPVRDLFGVAPSGFFYSPWGKIGIGTAAVFAFSLGYELTVGGQTYPRFGGMPAAWLSDRFEALYNIRATGRLATLASIFLLIEVLRRIDQLFVSTNWRAPASLKVEGPLYALLGSLVLVHAMEIAPFMKPFPSQRAAPIESDWAEPEVARLREISRGQRILMIAPSVWAVETGWVAKAFAAGYHSRLRSNLYYIARTYPEHDRKIARDLERVAEGSWPELEAEYGVPILFAVREPVPNALRDRVSAGYVEDSIGGVSFWKRRD